MMAAIIEDMILLRYLSCRVLASVNAAFAESFARDCTTRSGEAGRFHCLGTGDAIFARPFQQPRLPRWRPMVTCSCTRRHDAGDRSCRRAHGRHGRERRASAVGTVMSCCGRRILRSGEDALHAALVSCKMIYFIYDFPVAFETFLGVDDYATRDESALLFMRHHGDLPRRHMLSMSAECLYFAIDDCRFTLDMCIIFVNRIARLILFSYYTELLY